MADPTKAESEKLFNVLRAQKGNKVGQFLVSNSHTFMQCIDRHALTVKPGIRLGQVSLLVFIYAWTALAYIGIWACISVLYGGYNILTSRCTQTSGVNSSTNLDSWQLGQLRTMKVGGNASATEFFTRCGGASLLRDSDPKKKYSSRTAELYKEELAKRVKEDALKYVSLNVALLTTLIPVARFPARVLVEGMDSLQPTDSTEQTEDDFFSSWDKPAPAKLAPSSTTTPAPPVVGRPAARMVTSSSLRSTSSTAANSSVKPGASRLNSSGPAATTSTNASATAKKAKLGGLGAKKAAAPIDFADAERKAAEEAERIKQLGYDRQREEEEERAKQQAEQATQEVAKVKAANTSPAMTTIPGRVDVQKGNSQDLERLGMGFRKLGFGAVPAATQTASSARSTCVRKHFIFEPLAKNICYL